MASKKAADAAETTLRRFTATLFLAIVVTDPLTIYAQLWPRGVFFAKGTSTARYSRPS